MKISTTVEWKDSNEKSNIQSPIFSFIFRHPLDVFANITRDQYSDWLVIQKADLREAKTVQFPVHNLGAQVISHSPPFSHIQRFLSLLCILQHFLLEKKFDLDHYEVFLHRKFGIRDAESKPKENPKYVVI